MTPTDLTARVLRSLIPDYARYLADMTDLQRTLLAEVYKVSDILEWAQAHIENLERRAAELEAGIEKF